MTYHAQRILGTFDIKPTTTAIDAKPDELMIDWTTLPAGSTSSLYLPPVSAKDIRAMAAGMYGYQPFALVDAHTVGCDAQGVTYVPIPRALGNFAGLIDVVLPAKAQIGDKLTVAVSQLTNQSAEIPVIVNPFADVAMSRRSRQVTWRKVTGAFQLALKVKPDNETRPVVERNLAILRWIFESIPRQSRWHPVFVRYLHALSNQVSGLGGDPAKIPASATGTWPGAPGLESGSGHGSKAGIGGSRRGLVGKIEGLIFDHFGDFEGFFLETESGERFPFFSREKNLEEVVERAWAARLRVTVIPEDKDERHPRRIVLHPDS
jgi:hypothetical protein